MTHKRNPADCPWCGATTHVIADSFAQCDDCEASGPIDDYDLRTGACPRWATVSSTATTELRGRANGLREAAAYARSLGDDIKAAWLEERALTLLGARAMAMMMEGK